MSNFIMQRYLCDDTHSSATVKLILRVRVIIYHFIYSNYTWIFLALANFGPINTTVILIPAPIRTYEKTER